MRTSCSIVSVLLCAACPRSGDGDDATDAASETHASADPSGDPMSTTQGTSASTSGADAASTDASADETTATEPVGESSDGGESSTGEPPIQYCGLEDLKPGAPDPIVAGTEPMMIPPDIATILLDNCGCHYADMLDVGPPVADYSSLLPLRIETWEQWQGTFGPTMQSTLGVTLERVRDSPLQFTMPHRSCYIGDGERMVPADRATLVEWMEAGAPDGATWVP